MKGEHHARKTHCPKGHPYSGSNLRVIQRKNGLIRECRECRTISSRKHMAHSRKIHAKEENARRTLNRAVANGTILKPSVCSIGNSECRGRIEAHHKDYSKPLEVVWLCEAHHEKAHDRASYRNSRLLTFNGVTKSSTQWAKQVGIDAHTINARIDICGWTVEEALSTPLHNKLKRG